MTSDNQSPSEDNENIPPPEEIESIEITSSITTQTIDIPENIPTEKISKNVGNLSQLTPLQKAGVNILFWVGVAGASIIGSIFVVSFWGWDNKFW